jgi:hypothetical protein
MIAADHTPAEVPTVSRPATEAAELKKKTGSQRK